MVSSAKPNFMISSADFQNSERNPIQTPIPSKILAEELPELMTVKEAAAYLRVPLPSVYHLLQRGQLPAIQIGGRWRVKRSLVDRDVLKTEPSGLPAVLVVDDDEALQTTFKQFLKKAGFGRIVVGGGAKAIASAEKQKFDLVFLDLHIPDMSGVEVYLRLKELHPDLPIVIITGHPDSGMLSQILQIGHVTVIKKPIEFEQLMRMVKQLEVRHNPGSRTSRRDYEAAPSGFQA
jgi:excisionase family DNA binding protein